MRLHAKIPLKEVQRVLEKKSPHVTVCFREEIDTSSCEPFFGLRCPGGIHVTSPNCAHRDLVDPRLSPLDHLEKDVGVPRWLVGACLGAALGWFFAKGNKRNERWKLIMAFALVGAVLAS